jgi:hypothetical protein
VAQRLDRTPYQPGRPMDGLLVAADADCWQQVRRDLLPEA